MANHFELVATDIKVDKILAELDSKPWLWRIHTLRQDTPGSPHKDTESIYLRGPKSLDVLSVFNDLVVIDYPAFDELPQVRRLVIDGFVKTLGIKELGRVMITNLKAGGEIEPHADEGRYADHYERFHIPLRAKIAGQDGEKGNWFCCEFDKIGEGVQMQVGTCWWFHHKRRHWVMNETDEDRIHLIIDAVAPNYRRERDAA